MIKLIKALPFEVKEVTKEESEDGQVGYIEGYASTFGNVDLYGDIIEAGAFAKTIKERKGVWPVLLDHSPSKPIGWNIEATEDGKGLKVRSKILLETEEARNRYKLAKMAHELKTKMGISIGFNIVKSEPDKENPQVRRIKEAKMWEHSLVTFPANPKASTTAVKGLNEDQTLKVLKLLESKGCSIEEIKEALGEEAAELLHFQDPAAHQSVDPEILQSLARLTESLRA